MSFPDIRGAGAPVEPGPAQRSRIDVVRSPLMPGMALPWRASDLQPNQMPRYLVNQNRPVYVAAPDAPSTISMRRY